MKKLLVLGLALAVSAASASAANNPGIFGYGIELSATGSSATNPGQSTLYALIQNGETRLLPTNSTATLSTAWNNTSNDTTPTFNLGTYDPGAGDTLVLKGGSFLTFGNVDTTNVYLNYRITAGTMPAGGFVMGNNLPINSTDPSGNGNSDRRFASESFHINVLESLAPGTYTIDTYGFADGSFASNGGANFAATFTVVPEPATWMAGLFVCGAAGLHLARSRRTGLLIA